MSTPNEPERIEGAAGPDTEQGQRAREPEREGDAPPGPGKKPEPEAGAEPGSAGGEEAGQPGREKGEDKGGENKRAEPVVSRRDVAEVERLTEEMTGQIDAAMAKIGAGSAPARPAGSEGARETRGEQAGQEQAGASAPAARRPPPIRGPRVVQAGREHRTGTVVSVGPTDLFIEFGPKELGVAPRQQWKDEELPKVGDRFEVVVERYEPTESLFICSRPGAVQKAAWELLEVGQVVEARVTGTNKGGLELDVAGHRAFMPASQVSFDRVADLSVYIGEKVPCVVTQVDRRGKGNIVLSRREVLKTEREEKAKALRGSLKEGDVVEGTVRKIMPFGAFVDIGGVDGLVHISDLTHERVSHGEKAVQRHLSEGQRVKVKVLSIDWENNRISLGVKQLEADPFSAVLSEIVEGAEVRGRVTKLMEFGAFVEVSPGVEGLVHISEIAHRHIRHPSDAVKADELVSCKVLKIDSDSRRISLSIKALQEAPAAQGRGDRRGGRASEPEKEPPSLRRLREKFGNTGLKGGIG